MSNETATLTGNYGIDPSHSRIGFVARHAMVTKVRGTFNEFEGTGYFDAVSLAISGGKSSTTAMKESTEHDQFRPAAE